MRFSKPPDTSVYQVARDQLEFLIERNSAGLESCPEDVHRLSRVLRILLEPFETTLHSEVSINSRLRSRINTEKTLEESHGSD